MLLLELYELWDEFWLQTDDLFEKLGIPFLFNDYLVVQLFGFNNFEGGGKNVGNILYQSTLGW